MTSERTSWVGKPVKRVEDDALLRGKGRFVDDLDVPGTRHLAFVRSPVAAGTVTGVDVDRARAVPGVEAVFTSEDIRLPGFRSTSRRKDFTPITMPIIADGFVRHVGEPVAVVVGDSRYTAEDGAELVRVDYEPGPAVVSMEEALTPGAPVVNEGARSNVLLDVRQWEDAQLDTIFDSAHLVVDARFDGGRLTPAPIENRGCLAMWDEAEGRLTFHVSTQIPHILRTALGEQLSLPEHRIRVIVPDVGGGFGLKCIVGREEILAAWIARELRLPVKWIEDRYENLTAGFQAREQSYRIRAAFDRDGRILGLDADIAADVGAYSSYPFSYGIEPMQAAGDMPGPYKLPHYRSRARAIATNKCPSGPFRGVARPHVTLSLERLMDKAATQLDIDPLELRRRNLIRRDEFPYSGVTGLTYDPGTYVESLELCAQHLGYDTWRERQDAARREGRFLGLGLSCFNEHVGYGTAVFSKRTMSMTVGGEVVQARMDASGGVDLLVATLSHGQSHKTTYAQIAADELQVPPDRIRVLQGDTDVTPAGWGTFASRSISIAGGAVKRATYQLAERLKTIGAHLLEASPEDIELADGRVAIRGNPSRSYDVAEIAKIAHHQSQSLPPELGPGLQEFASFDPPGTFSNATHGAVVEVFPDTGEVEVVDYVVVEDCGTVINPTVVDGQIRGGVTQGIASALYEEMVYDESGQPSSGTLADYLIPTAGEIPPFRIFHLETPSEVTETGAKGMGEGGTIGAPAAVLNAVNDAIRPWRVEIDRIPVTPPRLLERLAEAPSERKPEFV